MLGAGGRQTPCMPGGVNDAGALPDPHVLAAGLPLHIVAEVEIGQEQNRLVRGYGIHHLDGITRRADEVAFGFYVN